MSGPTGEATDKWCILRTAGARTIPLMRSLVSAGVEAWTPVEVSRLRRSAGRRGKVDREGPMLPTFVFAKGVHIADLVATMADPRSRHPDFSIFMHQGRAALVADRSIDGLRSAEDKASRAHRRASNERVFKAGEQVKMPDGAFGGMTGIVTKGDAKRTYVHLGGLFDDVEIETFQLLPNQVGTPLP